MWLRKWIVIGGADKGGIIVREDEDLPASYASSFHATQVLKRLRRAPRVWSPIGGGPRKLLVDLTHQEELLKGSRLKYRKIHGAPNRFRCAKTLRWRSERWLDQPLGQ